jgi:hypothetical protein
MRQTQNTSKLGGNWEQELVVIRHNEAYLRLAGDGTNYRVMTATAGEDASGVRPCQDQDRLLEAAAQLARKHECVEDIKFDKKGRAYVLPFILSQSEKDSDDVFTKDVCELVSDFFVIYDGLKSVAAK